MDTQVSIGEYRVSLDKERKEKERIKEESEKKERLGVRGKGNNSQPQNGDTGFIRAFYYAVENLPELQRKAVEMRYIKGRTYKQIANALNITIGKARTEEFKGVQALRRNRSIRQYNEDVLENYAMRGTGLSAFRSNCASSAEIAVERTL